MSIKTVFKLKETLYEWSLLVLHVKRLMKHLVCVIFVQRDRMNKMDMIHVVMRLVV